MFKFNDYEEFIEPALYENPVICLEKVRDTVKRLNLSNADIIKLATSIRKTWDVYKKQDIQINIIVKEEGECNNKELIYDYNFNELISNIKQNGEYKSVNIKIDSEGYILDSTLLKMNITATYSSVKSKENNTVCFFLSFKGIDVFINGTLINSDNHINSYKDIASNKFLSIFEYKQILENFYIEEVRYDPDKYFFAYSSQIKKEKRDILKSKPKLLFSAPEERFQNRLVRYLRNNCADSVQQEVRNADNDRYDIWIITEDKKLFVIEIKWLGESVNADGRITSRYGKSRFLDGAYQLKEYVDNSETYSQLFTDTKIFQGILLSYDARENETDMIEFPYEFKKYPNLDLTSQHCILEKEKVKASNVYKQQVKKK